MQRTLIHDRQKKLQDYEKYKSLIFDKFCEKLLEYVDSVYPIIDNNSKLKSLIVESRWSKSIEFTIRNTIQKLGNGWGHIIVCTNNNLQQVCDFAITISENIEIFNLEDLIINRNTYNNLLLTLDFWNEIDCEKVLVYQSDTFIFEEFNYNFVEWDYIGAPWGPSLHSTLRKDTFNFEEEVHLGNGGLSFRNISAIKWCLENFKPGDNNLEKGHGCDLIWEDLFFSYQIHMSREYRLAPLEIAQKFSYEHIYFPKTFGCHQPYLNSMFNEDMFPTFLTKFKSINILNIIGNKNYLIEEIDEIITTLKLGKVPYTQLEYDLDKIIGEDNYFHTNLIIFDHKIQNLDQKIIHNKRNIILWKCTDEISQDIDIKFDKFFDQIWTTTEFSKNLIKKKLPNKTIKLIPNDKQELLELLIRNI